MLLCVSKEAEKPICRSGAQKDRNYASFLHSALPRGTTAPFVDSALLTFMHE